MAENGQNIDYLLRVIVVGDSGIGKSSLLMRYVDEGFNDNLLPTIGIDFRIKYLHQMGKNIKLQFWDTAGQERFRTISRNYYRGAHAIIFVYDITDRDSFKRIEYWINEVEQNSPPETIKILIGNKNDLEHKRQVEYDEAKALAASQGLEFFESSAKENKNIENAVNYIVKLFVRQKEIQERQQEKTSQIYNRQNSIQLTKSYTSWWKKKMEILFKCFW